jgi:hypothetical protein
MKPVQEAYMGPHKPPDSHFNIIKAKTKEKFMYFYKKSIAGMVFLSFLISNLFFSCDASACTPMTDNCIAISDFSDWLIKYGTDNIILNGSQINYSVQSTETTDGFTLIRFDPSNPIGMMATFDILSLNGVSRLGIRQYVGTWGDNYLEAQIYIWDSDDKTLHIGYRVRVQNTNNNNVKVLSVGELGGSNNYPTSDITIAFAKINNEIWFFAEGYDSIVWKPQQIIGNIVNKPEWSDAEKLGIEGWTEKGIENYGSATVKDVKILYNPTSTTLCDVNNDGKTGLAEAIYSLQVVSGMKN